MPSKPSREELTRLKATWDGAMAGLKDVEFKRLFGSDGYFVAGNLFALLSKDGRLGVRLPQEASRLELLGVEGTGPWRLGPLQMKHWVLLPLAWHHQAAKLRLWSHRAWAQALNLPEKTTVTGRARKPKQVRPAVFRKIQRNEGA